MNTLFIATFSSLVCLVIGYMLGVLVGQSLEKGAQKLKIEETRLKNRAEDFLRFTSYE